jgi:hypothetical protein
MYVRFPEIRFYRLRTTFTGEPVAWKKQNKKCVSEFWSGTRCKKLFDEKKNLIYGILFFSH